MLLTGGSKTVFARVTEESNVFFLSLRGMGLFFRSKPHGLVFCPRRLGLPNCVGTPVSVTYPWGGCPLPIPLVKLGAGDLSRQDTAELPNYVGFPVSPQISHEKHGGLPTVTSEKPHDPRVFLGMRWKNVVIPAIRLLHTLLRQDGLDVKQEVAWDR